MHAVILFAVLQGYISIPPIRVFQPYHDVKCPHGYSIWWPAGKEFDDDRYAECIKPVAKPVAVKSSRAPHGATASVSRTTKPAPVTPVSLLQRSKPANR